MVGRDTHPYNPDDIGELIEKELGDIEAENRNNDRGTDELAKGRRCKRFEERMYRGGKIVVRFEHVSLEETETFKHFPTWRLWVLCAATLGYFVPSDEPWRRVDLMNDDPYLLDDDSTRVHYSEKLSIEITQRSALAAKNLEDKGGNLPVQRRAEERFGPADDYVRQADFWPFAARMGWSVPEFAREQVSQLTPETGNQLLHDASIEPEHKDASGIQALQREDALTLVIQEVIRVIEGEGGIVSRATVYPRLQALADAGQPPFTGTRNRLGLQWRNGAEHIAYLDGKALAKRLTRRGYRKATKGR